MDTHAADVAALVTHLNLKNAIHIGHSTGGGEVARYVAQYGGGGRVAKAVLIGAVPPIMVKKARRILVGCRWKCSMVSVLRWQPIARSSTSRSRPARSTASIVLVAKVLQSVIDNWWRQGMAGGIKPHYDCIKAFSETDFTEDLKNIEVPTLVMHGDDDQIVPIADSALLSSKLLKKGNAEGLSRATRTACATTHADTDQCGSARVLSQLKMRRVVQIELLAHDDLVHFAGCIIAIPVRGRPGPLRVGRGSDRIFSGRVPVASRPSAVVQSTAMKGLI